MMSEEKVYAVITKSIFGGEEIDSIWRDKKKALKRKDQVRAYRVEEHKIKQT